MLKRLLNSLKQKRRKKRLGSQTSQEVFTTIHRRNKWGSTESRSGKGSDLKQTEVVRPILANLIDELKITTMVDLPCGDFNWMQHVDLSGLHYIGADIVPDLIASNAKYATGNIEFQVLNLTADTLPKADLYFVRDCLVHLSFADIEKALEGLIASNSTYLLTTIFPNEKQNREILTGEWRDLNLQLAPFNLPKPIRIISESVNPDNSYKSLALWKIKDIAAALALRQKHS